MDNLVLTSYFFFFIAKIILNGKKKKNTFKMFNSSTSLFSRLILHYCNHTLMFWLCDTSVWHRRNENWWVRSEDHTTNKCSTTQTSQHRAESSRSDSDIRRNFYDAQLRTQDFSILNCCQSKLHSFFCFLSRFCCLFIQVQQSFPILHLLGKHIHQKIYFL